jgi:hypothetical protein
MVANYSDVLKSENVFVSSRLGGILARHELPKTEKLWPSLTVTTSQQ